VAALVRAELLKIRSTRLYIWLALGLCGLVILGVAGSAYAAGQQGTPPLETPEGLRSLFQAAGSGTPFALVLGIIGMSGEWRHRTATSTFLAEPRRGRVVAAKLIAFALVGVIYAVVAISVTIVAALVALSIKNVDASVTEHGVPGVLLGAGLATAIYGIVGVGYGALVPNQVAALVTALVWSSVVDSLLVELLPAIGKWTPGGAAQSLSSYEVDGQELLPIWGGALLLTVYGVAFALAGTRLAVSRDIT
jgi:ABC-2 type transport system permease protein